MLFHKLNFSHLLHWKQIKSCFTLIMNLLFMSKKMLWFCDQPFSANWATTLFGLNWPMNWQTMFEILHFKWKKWEFSFPSKEIYLKPTKSKIFRCFYQAQFYFNCTFLPVLNRQRFYYKLKQGKLTISRVGGVRVIRCPWCSVYTIQQW